MPRSPERDKGKEIKEKEKEKKAATPPAFEFEDSGSVEDYLEWKHSVPVHLRRLVEGNIKGNTAPPSATGLPLTDQFLDNLASCLAQKQSGDLAGVDKRIQNFLRPLDRVQTKGGYLNVFETLTSRDASWRLKQRLYETQIRTALEWLTDKDLSDLEQETQETQEAEGEGEADQEQTGQDDTDIPPTNEDVRSSMEAGMEKKEGEPAKALFSVKPFYGGYYRQLVFRHFDAQTLEWGKEENEFTPAESEITNPLESRLFFGKIRGSEPLALPIAYNSAFDPESFESDAPEGTTQLYRNQDGLWCAHIDAPGVFRYSLRLSKRQHMEDVGEFVSEMGGALPTEITQKIAELKASRLPRLKQKRELVKFIRNALKYSQSREAWQYYTQNPAEYFTRIWERKEADCKVSNDLACRALAEIDNNFQYVTGFYVKEHDEQGNAIMHSGNGHAWNEVWDNGHIVRLDATPKGDPNLDEEEQERDLEGESGEGDYGDNDDEIMNEEEAQDKLKELQKSEGSGGKGKKKSPEFNVEERDFAGLAECTPAQAREFFSAIDRVREIKDEQGVSIIERMKDEWKKIIMEHKIEMMDYRGPVKMREGDRLDDPASAVIDLRMGDANPTGFEKIQREEKIESDFGGINIYFSFDLSGSMAQPDGATGRSKADVQRDVALLFVDSLMQCAYVTRQTQDETGLLPVKIMVTLASGTGSVALPLTDKWGPKEQWAMYSALVRLASGGTPTHQTLQLIERDFDTELADLKKKGVPADKQPIHYTAEISDGSPDDFAATEQMHTKLKGKKMFMRSYCIGGTSSSADAAPPLSSFSELPKILATDIIEQFKKLHPRKVVS